MYHHLPCFVVMCVIYLLVRLLQGHARLVTQSVEPPDPRRGPCIAALGRYWGGIMTKLGCFASYAVVIIGFGIFTHWNKDSGIGKWVGFLQSWHQ